MKACSFSLEAFQLRTLGLNNGSQQPSSAKWPRSGLLVTQWAAVTSSSLPACPHISPQLIAHAAARSMWYFSRPVIHLLHLELLAILLTRVTSRHAVCLMHRWKILMGTGERWEATSGMKVVAFLKCQRCRKFLTHQCLSGFRGMRGNGAHFPLKLWSCVAQHVHKKCVNEDGSPHVWAVLAGCCGSIGDCFGRVASYLSVVHGAYSSWLSTC
eukprot:364945-Chlamydomonas_euryale.AAC.4